MGNDGGTSTRGLRYSAVCVTFTEVPNDPFSYSRLRAARSYSLTLVPKQTVRPVLCSYSLQEWATIMAFKAKIYVYGRATYRDTMNQAETHIVEFCTRMREIRFSPNPLDLGPGAMAEECQRHNCRDDERAAQDAMPTPRRDPNAF